MKRLHTATLLALATLLTATFGAVFTTTAQAATSGSGTIAIETRAVSGFEAIAQNGDIDVLVRQGAAEGVGVQAEDNMLRLVETVVEPGAAGPTLQIRYKRGESIGQHRAVKVTVNVVRLTSLASAGAGDLTVEALKTPALKLLLSGASDARFGSLVADSFEVRISGSGDVAARGSAKTVKISIAGSGDADMAGLAADDVSVRIAGSGDASVTANKSLDVSLAGSGDVRYGGDVTAVNQRVAGSGSVRRR